MVTLRPLKRTCQEKSGKVGRRSLFGKELAPLGGQQFKCNGTSTNGTGTAGLARVTRKVERPRQGKEACLRHRQTYEEPIGLRVNRHSLISGHRTSVISVSGFAATPESTAMPPTVPDLAPKALATKSFPFCYANLCTFVRTLFSHFGFVVHKLRFPSQLAATG